MLKRSDLPPLAFTVDPTGRVHLLIDGRARLHFGTTSLIAAPPLSADGAAMALEIRLPVIDPVVKHIAWETLGAISKAEEAAKAG